MKKWLADTAERFTKIKAGTLPVEQNQNVLAAVDSTGMTGNKTIR